MKLEFAVGGSQQHHVQYSWNQWTGNVRIAVDGSVVRRDCLTDLDPKLRGGPATLTRSWSFQVGDKERLEVRIDKIRPQWFAGLRRSTFQVFVDDNLLMQRHGY